MKNKIILPLIVLNMLFGVGSAVMIAVSGGSSVWIGSMMATIPLPFFLMVMTKAGALRLLVRISETHVLGHGVLAVAGR